MTIKHKIIGGVFLLILVSQAISSLVYYRQTRSAILQALELEAEGTSVPFLLKLSQQVQGSVPDENQPVENSLLAMFAAALSLEFNQLVESQSKLHSLLLLDKAGTIIAHHSLDGVGQSIDASVQERNQLQQLLVSEAVDQIEVMVPYFFHGHHAGAMVFHYSAQQIHEERAQALWVALLLFAAYFVLGGMGALLLSRHIVGRIKGVHSAVKNIVDGEGDLTRRLDSQANDEVGALVESFNRFIEYIQGLVQSIEQEASVLNTVVEELSYTTDEMQKTTDSLAEITEEEDSRITDTASTIGTMASDLQMITQEVQETAHNACLAEQNAEAGNEAVLHANRSMVKIEQSSQEIEGIIHVITEISNQTNLLSLNAAIEAAKASEYGKGFAVVADEIRQLAERSSQAVLEIQKLIESSSSNVSEGNTIIQETGHSLNEIIGQVREITQQINSISEGITQQDQAIHQISESADGIRHMSENTAAVVAELSSATGQINTSTHELSQMSHRLMTRINQFKVR